MFRNVQFLFLVQSQLSSLPRWEGRVWHHCHVASTTKGCSSAGPQNDVVKRLVSFAPGFWYCTGQPEDSDLLMLSFLLGCFDQSSGVVWKSRWPSWVPPCPYGLCGHKATSEECQTPPVDCILHRPWWWQWPTYLIPSPWGCLVVATSEQWPVQISVHTFQRPMYNPTVHLSCDLFAGLGLVRKTQR